MKVIYRKEGSELVKTVQPDAPPPTVTRHTLQDLKRQKAALESQREAMTAHIDAQIAEIEDDIQACKQYGVTEPRNPIESMKETSKEESCLRRK